MKFLILLFVSLNALADSTWFPVGKDGANINYANSSHCEESEGQTCYDVSDCPMDVCELVTIHEQDPETGINHPHKVLRNSEEKKLAIEKAIKDKEDVKLAKKAAIVSAEADLDKATTIAGLKAAIKKLRDAEKE